MGLYGAMSFTSTNFILRAGISLIRLSHGAVASPIASANAGHLFHLYLNRGPAGIAELGASLSETNRYRINIGDEPTAKPEHVRRAREALFQCSL